MEYLISVHPIDNVASITHAQEQNGATDAFVVSPWINQLRVRTAATHVFDTALEALKRIIDQCVTRSHSLTGLQSRLNTENAFDDSLDDGAIEKIPLSECLIAISGTGRIAVSYKEYLITLSSPITILRRVVSQHDWKEIACNSDGIHRSLSALCWLEDGRLLIGTSLGELLLWDETDGEQIQSSMRLHNTALTSLKSCISHNERAASFISFTSSNRKTATSATNSPESIPTKTQNSAIICVFKDSIAMIDLESLSNKPPSEENLKLDEGNKPIWNVRKWAIPSQIVQDASICSSAMFVQREEEELLRPQTHKLYFLVVGSDPSFGVYREEQGEILSLASVATNIAGTLATKLVRTAVSNKMMNIARNWWNTDSKSPSSLINALSGRGVSSQPLPASESLLRLRSLTDTGRSIRQVMADPINLYTVLSDNIGRVLLIDMSAMVVARIWKGYRDAQCAIISEASLLFLRCDRSKGNNLENTALYLALYAPRRGLLELWALPFGKRVGALNIGRNSRLHFVPFSASCTSSSNLSVPTSSPILSTTAYLIRENGDLQHLLLQIPSNQTNLSASLILDSKAVDHLNGTDSRNVPIIGLRRNFEAYLKKHHTDCEQINCVHLESEYDSLLSALECVVFEAGKYVRNCRDSSTELQLLISEIQDHDDAVHDLRCAIRYVDHFIFSSTGLFATLQSSQLTSDLPETTQLCPYLSESLLETSVRIIHKCLIQAEVCSSQTTLSDSLASEHGVSDDTSSDDVVEKSRKHRQIPLMFAQRTISPITLKDKENSSFTLSFHSASPNGALINQIDKEATLQSSGNDMDTFQLHCVSDELPIVMEALNLVNKLRVTWKLIQGYIAARISKPDGSCYTYMTWHDFVRGYRMIINPVTEDSSQIGAEASPSNKNGAADFDRISLSLRGFQSIRTTPSQSDKLSPSIKQLFNASIYKPATKLTSGSAGEILIKERQTLVELNTQAEPCKLLMPIAEVMFQQIYHAELLHNRMPCVLSTLYEARMDDAEVIILFFLWFSSLSVDQIEKILLCIEDSTNQPEAPSSIPFKYLSETLSRMIDLYDKNLVLECVNSWCLFSPMHWSSQAFIRCLLYTMSNSTSGIVKSKPKARAPSKTDETQMLRYHILHRQLEMLQLLASQMYPSVSPLFLTIHHFLHDYPLSRLLSLQFIDTYDSTQQQSNPRSVIEKQYLEFRINITSKLSQIQSSSGDQNKNTSFLSALSIGTWNSSRDVKTKGSFLPVDVNKYMWDFTADLDSIVVSCISILIDRVCNSRTDASNWIKLAVEMLLCLPPSSISAGLAIYMFYTVFAQPLNILVTIASCETQSWIMGSHLNDQSRSNQNKARHRAGLTSGETKIHRPSPPVTPTKNSQAKPSNGVPGTDQTSTYLRLIKNLAAQFAMEQVLYYSNGKSKNGAAKLVKHAGVASLPDSIRKPYAVDLLSVHSIFTVVQSADSLLKYIHSCVLQESELPENVSETIDCPLVHSVIEQFSKLEPSRKQKGETDDILENLWQPFLLLSQEDSDTEGLSTFPFPSILQFNRKISNIRWLLPKSKSQSHSTTTFATSGCTSVFHFHIPLSHPEALISYANLPSVLANNLQCLYHLSALTVHHSRLRLVIRVLSAMIELDMNVAVLINLHGTILNMFPDPWFNVDDLIYDALSNLYISPSSATMTAIDSLLNLRLMFNEKYNSRQNILLPSKNKSVSPQIETEVDVPRVQFVLSLLRERPSVRTANIAFQLSKKFGLSPEYLEVILREHVALLYERGEDARAWEAVSSITDRLCIATMMISIARTRLGVYLHALEGRNRVSYSTVVNAVPGDSWTWLAKAPSPLILTTPTSTTNDYAQEDSRKGTVASLPNVISRVVTIRQRSSEIDLSGIRTMLKRVMVLLDEYEKTLSTNSNTMNNRFQLKTTATIPNINTNFADLESLRDSHPIHYTRIYTSQLLQIVNLIQANAK